MIQRYRLSQKNWQNRSGVILVRCPECNKLISLEYNNPPDEDGRVALVVNCFACCEAFYVTLVGWVPMLGS